jgi:hypothetical protein
VATHQHRQRQGKIYASVYVRLVDRKARKRRVDEMSVVLRERLKQVPGITVTHVGLLDSVGGNKQILFSIQRARIPLSWTRLTATGDWTKCARSWPGGSGLQRQTQQPTLISVEVTARPGVRSGPLGGSNCQPRCAPWWRGKPWATGAPPMTRPMTSTCAWHPRHATTPRHEAAALHHWAPTPMAARASCGLTRWPPCANPPAPTRSTGAT